MVLLSCSLVILYVKQELNKMGLLLKVNGDVEVTRDTKHLMGKKILLRTSKGLIVCGNTLVETDKQRYKVNLFVNLLGEVEQTVKVTDPTLPMYFYRLNPDVSDEQMFLMKCLLEEDEDPKEDEESEWLKQNLPLSYHVRCIHRHKKFAQATNKST